MGKEYGAFQCPVCQAEGLELFSFEYNDMMEWKCRRGHRGTLNRDTEEMTVTSPRGFKSVAESDAAPTPPVGGQRTGLQPPEAPWPSINMAGRSMLNEAEIAHLLCEACGVPSGPTEEGYREQAMVFVQAFLIFCQRTDRHGSSWKQSGWRGALFDSHKKMDRLWQEFMINEEPPPDLDSALDLLNFVAFFVRGRANNIEGTWGWRS